MGHDGCNTDEAIDVIFWSSCAPEHLAERHLIKIRPFFNGVD
jgi:hypothetical protein